jgi:pimeloyl-ACP methyl ester carboxylesterase
VGFDFTVRLRDGRNVGIAVVGDEGSPILHCHGSGSSRLEVELLTTQAEQAGVRLMALDRPGIGRSDPKPGYRLLDWPDDVAEVADHLGSNALPWKAFPPMVPMLWPVLSKFPNDSLLVV